MIRESRLWMALKPKQRPSQGPDTPLQQDWKDNIQQAAASWFLVYKPAAWDHCRTDRSEQHTAAMIRNIQGDLKQLAQVPHLSQNKEECLFSHGTAALEISPTYPTQRRRETSWCRGGSITHCLQLRAELVLVCCCTVVVFPERESPVKLIEMGLHTSEF